MAKEEKQDWKVVLKKNGKKITSITTFPGNWTTGQVKDWFKTEVLELTKLTKVKEEEQMSPENEMTPKQEMRYADDLASRLPKDLTTEDDILAAGFKLAEKDIGRRSAIYYFQYDEDFPSDLVSAYKEATPLGALSGQKYESYGRRVMGKFLEAKDDRYWTSSAKDFNEQIKKRYGEVTRKNDEHGRWAYFNKAGEQVALSDIDGEGDRTYSIFQTKAVKESAINEAGEYKAAYDLGKTHALNREKKNAPWPKEYPYDLHHKAYNTGYKDWKPKTAPKDAAPKKGEEQIKESLMREMVKMIPRGRLNEGFSDTDSVFLTPATGPLAAMRYNTFKEGTPAEHKKAIKYHEQDADRATPAKAKFHDMRAKMHKDWLAKKTVKEAVDMEAVRAMSDAGLKKMIKDFESQVKMGSNDAKAGLKALKDENKRRDSAGYVGEAVETFKGYDVHHNPDSVMVLVLGSDEGAQDDYYGINVVFKKPGTKPELVTSDDLADRQAAKYKAQIIAAAEKRLGKEEKEHLASL